jgi:hypothetical protein
MFPKMYNMKRLILFLLMPLLWVGCKKDGGKTKEILLAEVSTNGAVTTRILYSDDNKPVRYETYSGGAINGFLKFEYDANGYIAKLGTYIMPGETPAVRIIFQCDADGRIITHTNYDLTSPTPNAPSSITTRTYNAQGALSTAVSKDNNGDLLKRLNYLYFPDGNLKELQTFKEASNQLWMSGKSVYSIPNGFYPKGADRLRTILGNEFLANLFSESIHDYTYDQNGAIVTHSSRIMSAREFNDDGSLKKQVQTYKSVKPPQPEVVSNAGYGYITQ